MTILDPGFSSESRSLSAIESIPQSGAIALENNLTSTSPLTRSSAGNGLQAQYYQGKGFSNLKHTRTDATVNFDWKRDAPDASLQSDDFSVRWTGQIWSKHSENYTFYTRSDDGVRLWVDGKIVIDHWTDHSVTEDQGSIALAAGQPHDIKLEYYENGGDAVIELLWSSPSQAKEVIPQSQLDAIAAPALISSAPDQTSPMIPVTLDTIVAPIIQPQAGSDNQPIVLDSTASISAMSKDSITTTVDWNSGKGGNTAFGYGVNAYQGFRTGTFDSAAYKSNMATMSPGMIRFHNGSTMQDSSTSDGLIDTARQTWDANKAKSALSASFAAFGQNQPERMINIPTWPDWMDADRDGFLDRNQFDNFARLCADLVKIVNQDARLKVKYWEVTNEKDNDYFVQFRDNSGWGGLKDSSKPDRLNELITIYNKAAVAMKQADPTIKIGGPAVARPDLQPFYVPFIKGTIDHLDFFTYHYYASGNASTADQDIFNATRFIGGYTKTIVAALKAASPNRTIPAMLGEYNISWTWESRDPRMANYKGVVFDALSIAQALTNGAAGTLAWNEKDGIYGKMDDQGNLRPGGEFLQLLNRYMIGDRISTTTSNENAITTFAVSNTAQGYKSFLIINQSNNSQQVQSSFTGWSPRQSSVATHTMSASGYSQKTVNWSNLKNGIVVPSNSVILLTFAD
ncbi:hypothetical protein H6F51_04295 [Cyanobacteria bacterium FACHB-DQ100]|nr:hypothetical protein [Cyanobacteria bacterium FACHB-DQ100]